MYFVFLYRKEQRLFPHRELTVSFRYGDGLFLTARRWLSLTIRTFCLGFIRERLRYTNHWNLSIVMLCSPLFSCADDNARILEYTFPKFTPSSPSPLRTV